MTSSSADRPSFLWTSTGIPRPSSSTCTLPSANSVTTIRRAYPAKASSTALSTTSLTRWWRPDELVEPMYMLGRRRTCSRPSRTWICSAVYATSAPRAWGLREGSGRGFLTAITGASALPARRKLRGQLGRTSGPQFYRNLNTKKAPWGLLTGVFRRLLRGRFPAQDRVFTLAHQVGVALARRGHLVEPSDGQAFGLCV